MTRLEAAVVAVAAASLSLLGACGDDSNEMGPNGGAGGSQGGSAGNGGSGNAGAAGSGGSAGMGGTAGMAGSAGAGGASAARFQAAVSGDVLTLTPLDPVWFTSCSNAIQSVQLVNGSWAPLRDDRPEAFGGHYDAHYLDGAFHSACYLNLGCDVSICSPLTADVGAPWERKRPPAREYVQIGQATAPPCGDLDAGVDGGPQDAAPQTAEPLDAGPDAGGGVPALESRAASGPLGVRVRYFLDGNCSGTELTADVPVE